MLNRKFKYIFIVVLLLIGCNYSSNPNNKVETLYYGTDQLGASYTIDKITVDGKVFYVRASRRTTTNLLEAPINPDQEVRSTPRELNFPPTPELPSSQSLMPETSVHYQSVPNPSSDSVIIQSVPY